MRAIPDNAAFLLFAGLLVAAVWILARPYIGVRHDGVLYLGQVFLQWYPEIFKHDLFFQFGSQDQFSIVAPLLAALYRSTGLAVGQIALIALNQVFVLLIVLVWLRRAGANATECVLGLVAMGVMSHNYGGWSIFAFTERFVTGRTFAEPFALLGLLFVERGRIAAGAAAIAAAMLFHPLIAVPVMVVAWGILVLRDRRWAWAALVIPLAFALGLAGIDPFTRLVQSIDEEWMKAIRKANGHIFVLGWPWEDKLAVALDCALVWVASRVFPSLGTLLRVTAVATAVLVGVSILTADGLENLLFTQLQLWRIHWLTHLLALAFLPVLLMRTWRRDDPLAQTLVMAVAAVAVASNVRYVSVTMLTLWAGLLLWMYVNRPAVSPALLRGARAVTGVALAGIGILVLLATAGQLAQARGHDLGLAYLVLIAMTMPLISFPAVLGLLYAWRRGGWAAGAAFALVAAGLVFGVANWDQRQEWVRHYENNLHQVHPWEKLIGPTEQVLWWEQAPIVWGLLHRPSYYSVLQGAGLLFNRGTAMEHQYRGRVTGAIQIQRDVCDLMSGLDPDKVDSECWPTMEAVEDACKNDHRIAYVILDRKLPRGAVAQWMPHHNGTTYHLHDCRQIR